MVHTSFTPKSASPWTRRSPVSRAKGDFPLVASSVQVLDHARQADVQKPDLAVEVVDLLLQGGVAVLPPVEADGARHEVDGDHEAEGKDGVLGLALVFLEDVDAGKSEEDDPDNPEETPA